MQPRPIVLIILDGWGHRKETEANAIAQANIPNWDYFWKIYPHVLISGTGIDVGLPHNQVGNSEVGHITLGSGRVLSQNLTKINLSIKNYSFYENPAFHNAVVQLSNSNKALHILTLLSPGGIHSHEHHTQALLKLLAKSKKKPNVYLHTFLDGRDTAPKSAYSSLNSLSNCCKFLKIGEIASIMGRYYAMDRDKRYERTQAAYNLLTLGQSNFFSTDPISALQEAYNRGETDEFIQPTRIQTKSSTSLIQDGDSVIFMNLRADRARQLSYALTNPTFSGFCRTVKPTLSNFITLTKYAEDLNATIAFPNDSPVNVLGEYLQNLGLKQLRIAETEKFAHVTFFFNGGKEEQFKGEERILIPSPSVRTYESQPEMSSFQITDKLISAILNKKHDVIICNFANADILGHTAKLKPTIKAIETLDICLVRIIQALNQANGEALITADHGNAEQLFNSETQQPHTAHTKAPLPFLYVGNRNIQIVKKHGTLADVTPTLLTLLGQNIPEEMNGTSLFNI